MDLIFLYGAPAVGKLTIAKELEKITGYPLFHNHLVAPVSKLFFQMDSVHAIELRNKIRLDVFEITAKHKVPGMIFTVCYSHPEDDDFVKDVFESVEKN